jgi:hypothetical protein
MTSIIREFAIGADEERAWAALADVASINKLITFLGPVTVDGDVRTVDMGEFGIIEELIVSLDADERRLSYTLTKSPWNFQHHHSSMQILPPHGTDSGARVRWIVDLKPDSAAEEFATGLDGAVESLKNSLS